MTPQQKQILKLPNKPLWHEDGPSRSALESEIDTDVVIIGAGYTGLWTAYYLLKMQPATRVVVIDRCTVGYGASGRNGGWASAIFPISLARVREMYSHEDALMLQRAMNATVDEIGRVLKTEGISADYAKEGFLSLARTDPQVKRVSAAVNESMQFGLPDQWRALSQRDASMEIGASSVKGGLYTEHCALIHPGKLVRGLAAVVEKLGGRIYENSPAISIGSQCVMTDKGRVNASTVIRATEAFTCQQPGQRRSVVPLYSLVLGTEPLPPKTLSQLQLTRRLAFNDMRHLRVYGQVTADGRLVFGGRGAPYQLGSKITDASDLVDSVHLNVHSAMLEFFPDLRDVVVTHRWGGALGVARDWCPTVSFDPVTRMGWAGNYVGDGVATSNLAGRILADQVLGRDDFGLSALPVVNHRSPAWEPEPLRWLGINCGLAATGFSDLEERMTNRPSKTAKLLEKLTGAH